MTARSAHVYDVDDSSFETRVVERSRSVAVVVDFWAPWCGPCRQLGPILERLAEQYDGQFELAKLNTDENPRVAQAFRIEGIPAVKAFKGGRLVNEFVGALPEAQVRAFLAPLLPSEADRLSERGDELYAAGHLNAAEDAYREALAKQTVHAPATIGLARILAGRGDADRGEALRLLSTFPNDAGAAALQAEINLSSAADIDTDPLEARLAANPNDVEAHYELGMAQAAAGQHEESLEHLLTAVRIDRNFRDDAARKAMVDLFNLLGDENPLTQRYRRRLSQLLF